MKTSTCIHLVSSALLLAGSAQAQVPLFHGDHHSFQLAEPGEFTRTAVGELNGDGILDVVQLFGDGQAIILFDPAELEALIPLPGLRNDLDVLPQGAPDGRDAVAEVGSSGLRLTWVDATSGSLVQGESFATYLAGGSLVRAIELDGEPGTDLVVLAANGFELHILAAGDAGFSPWLYLESEHSARAAVGVQWDGVGALELALLTDAGVYVYRVDPTTGLTELQNFHDDLPGSILTKVGQTGQAERLVWINESTGSTQWMKVLEPSGVTEEVNLWNLGAVGVGVGDYNKDGFNDLVVSHSLAQDLMGMRNLRSPAALNAVSFTGDFWQLYDFPLLFPVPEGSASPVPSNRALPALADFDLDHDVDIVCGARSAGVITVLHGDHLDESEQRPQLKGPFTLDCDSMPAHLEMEVKGAAPSPTSELQVNVWRIPAFPGPVLPHLADRYQEPFVSGARIRIPIPDRLTTAAYGLQLRFVDGTPQGLALRPSANFLFSLNPSVYFNWSEEPGFISVNNLCPLDDPGGGLVERPVIGPFPSPPR